MASRRLAASSPIVETIPSSLRGWARASSLEADWVGITLNSKPVAIAITITVEVNYHTFTSAIARLMAQRCTKP
jgi:hypothetical protein